MKSSSLSLIKNHGISNPRKYRDSLVHDWSLKDDTSRHLSIFIMRRIHTADLFSFIRDGELIFNKRLYSVIWMNHPSIIKKQECAAISLRYCPILERGYALVRTDCDNKDTPILTFNTQQKEFNHGT